MRCVIHEVDEDEQSQLYELMRIGAVRLIRPRQFRREYVQHKPHPLVSVGYLITSYDVVVYGPAFAEMETQLWSCMTRLLCTPQLYSLLHAYTLWRDRDA